MQSKQADIMSAGDSTSSFELIHYQVASFDNWLENLNRDTMFIDNLIHFVTNCYYFKLLLITA